MIVSGDTFLSTAPTRHFDVAIVGAGTVGLCLASTLRKAGVSVVLLEAGGASANASSNSDTATSAGHPHEGTDIGRAAGLGGTSTLWAGQLVEFDPPDLSRKDSSWPISYATLAGWYKKTYSALGVGPRPPLSAYQKEMGIEVDPDAAVEPLVTRWLPEPNFARIFADDVKSDMPVITGVEASEITFDGDRAVAISGQTDAGETLRITADHIVLAASTIGNSRLALALQRQPGCPWAENTFVGKYFQDHLGGAVGNVEVLDDAAFRNAFEHGKAFGQKFEPKFKATNSVSEQTQIGINGAFLFHSALHAHLSNLKQTVRAARNGVLHSEIASLPKDLARIGKSFVPLVKRYVMDRRVLGFYDQGVEFYVQSEQIPLYESCIELDRNHQGSGLPKAIVNWKVDGREVDAIRQFVEATGARLADQGIAKMTPAPELAQRESGLSLLADTYHQAGGLRMSTASNQGVTDADGRIWNTKNVYVAGAAVMPSSSHANVTLTGVALSLRLAAHLAAKIKQPTVTLAPTPLMVKKGHTVSAQ